jgi:hypothetical protein
MGTLTLPGGATPTPTSTPSATATSTPQITATPTSTTSATVTNTVTPLGSVTACPIQFSDVPPTNPFYAYIRCLACRGIISGYNDGTFRWGNPVTRGQLSKIIAGAANFNDVIPAFQQTFEDVPRGPDPELNPFWLWIERLYLHGAVSGYTCGGPGEPCGPGNRPYFRPAASATRGQIAKITSDAAQLSNPIPPAQQTFIDVPGTNVFWIFVERLAGLGVISGYACGGPGEPCDPQQRPYFRWGASATRGQMSKIAAETFFPGCQTPAKR